MFDRIYKIDKLFYFIHKQRILQILSKNYLSKINTPVAS